MEKMEETKVDVYFKDWKVMTKIMSSEDTIAQLVAELEQQVGREVIMVYNGKILNQNFSIGYYGIKDGAKIFMVPEKQKAKRTRSPRDILLELLQDIGRLENYTFDEYCDKMAKIETHLNEERMRQFVDVDPWAANVVSYIIDFAENCTRQLSDSEKRTLCQLEDNWLLWVENTKDGMKLLVDALEDQRSVETVKQETVVPSAKSELSSEPLPACWRRIPAQLVEIDLKSCISNHRATGNILNRCKTQTHLSE